MLETIHSANVLEIHGLTQRYKIKKSIYMYIQKLEIGECNGFITYHLAVLYIKKSVKLHVLGFMFSLLFFTLLI